MSISQMLKKFETKGKRLEIDDREVDLREIRGPEHILERLKNLQQTAKNATDADEMYDLLNEAAEYAMAAEHLNLHYAHPAKNDIKGRQMHEAAQRSMSEVETILQEIIKSYRKVSH
ncbi:MAG: hypothetical protein ABH859_07925 [Pseudomonadota bacterium]